MTIEELEARISALEQTVAALLALLKAKAEPEVAAQLGELE